MPLRGTKTIQIDNVDYNTKLTIRPAQRGDSGEYQVTATNSSGRDQVTVTVTVTAKPTKPEGPLAVIFIFMSLFLQNLRALINRIFLQISDIHKEGCTLKWKRPLDDGGTPIEYYQVDKLDTETGCWVPCARAAEPSKYTVFC